MGDVSSPIATRLFFSEHRRWPSGQHDCQRDAHGTSPHESTTDVATMFLLILAYFGGVLTILSPCILPVLPFVFARADRPFARNGLPMLLGMALTFALVATLAAVGGGWAIRANQYGRIVALAVLAVLGLTLLSSHV